VRRYIPIIILILLVIFLIIKLEDKDGSLKQLKSEVNELNDSKTIYYEAGDIAQEFINAYFIYDIRPDKEKVKEYIVDEKLNELDFGEDKKDGEDLGDIYSDVKRLDIYYGDSSVDKQKILGIFTNEITLNNVESEVQTFLELDMEKVKGEWKVVDLQLYQM